MKKIGKVLAVISAVTLTATTLVSCGGNESGDANLKIGFLNAGYGDEWIKSVVASYTAETGVQIELDGDAQFSSKVINELGSGNTDYDIMISESASWASFAATGALANLNDVFASVDANGVSLESRYDANALHYATAIGTDRQTGYYSLPLFSSVGGIVYNVEMFEYYNWQIPTTVSELVTLCARIKQDTAVRKWTTKEGESVEVAPFVFPGQYNFYWDFLIYNWWIQYDGTAKVTATYNPESKNALLTDGMKEAMRAFETLNIKSGANSNALAGSDSKDHTNANTDFAKGLAAMMPSGSWAETEVKKNYENSYQMGLIPSLYIDANHKVNASYCISINNVFVPSVSDNVDGAKAFLKYLAKAETLQTITKLSGGIHPLEYGLDSLEEDVSPFMQGVIDIYKNNTIVYPISSHPLIKYGITQPWPLGSAAKMLLSGSYANYQAVYSTIGKYIDDNWSLWQQKMQDYIG